MIISTNWLNDYLPHPVDTDELTNKIGARLVEIEGVTSLHDKYKSAVIARVASCVEHPDSDHLHICLIDDGGVVANVPRDDHGYVQVVCGAPNVCTNLVVVWLPPGSIVPSSYGSKDEFCLSSRKLRGVLSQGMLASPSELGLWNDHDGIMEITDDRARPGDRLMDLLALDDYLLEVENKSLTHRPDCFGVIGFAREVAAILGQTAQLPDWFNRLKASLAVADTVVAPTVTITDSSLCARYECVVLTNVDSACNLPDNWRSRLAMVGVNSISAPVDITNYLMLETGQPLHAFDLDRVMEISPTGKPDLVIRAAAGGEELELLDGRIVKLADSDIVVAVGDPDNNVPIALAGAMGGMATEITSDTKRVLLESATFDLYHLRTTQFRHGIFSEAITRFTKGQPADLTHPVLVRAAEMFCQCAGAMVSSQIIDAYPVKPNMVEFAIPVSQFAAVLGQYHDGAQVGYDAELIADTLRRLQYVNVVVDGEVVKATAPWWRTDLHIAEDVIEDIGRVNGYDNITADSPVRHFVAAPYDVQYQKQMWLRDRLREAGGNEVVTYSFVHGDLLDGVGDDKSQAFRIVNAISPDLQYYRRDLLPGLIVLARDNLRAGYDNFLLFEVGKVHRRGMMDRNEPDLPAELPEVSGIVLDKARRTDSAYYTIKRVVEYALNLSGYQLSFVRLDQFVGELDKATNLFEPTRSAAVVLNGEKECLIGVVGEFRSEVRHKFKLPDFVAGFSLMLADLVQYLDRGCVYTPVLRYQGTDRDITYQVSSNVNYETVQSFTRQTLNDRLPDGMVAKITPRDIYAAGSDRQNITLHIEFHDLNRTVNAKLVNKTMDTLARLAQDELRAKVI